MTPIEKNPNIDQEVVRQLTTLGVTLTPAESETGVVAQFASGITMTKSGRIFQKLAQLGRKGYDKDSLQIRTAGEVVNVTFNLIP